MQQNTVILPGPCGDLEAVLTTPSEIQSGLGFTRVALVCHPHPLHGGTMNNKVVTTVARAYADSGLPCLRFNFRGVGQSVGTYDEGQGETEDALAALRWLDANYHPQFYDLLGFSFGSYVAYRVATRWPAARLITIAPAVTRCDFSLTEIPTCPWAVIQPEADEVVDPASVYDFVKRLPASVQLQRIPEASHFFHSKLLELRQCLTDLIQTL
jgi:alpha/beta superfamily hydrolase